MTREIAWHSNPASLVFVMMMSWQFVWIICSNWLNQWVLNPIFLSILFAGYSWNSSNNAMKYKWGITCGLDIFALLYFTSVSVLRCKITRCAVVSHNQSHTWNDIINSWNRIDRNKGIMKKRYVDTKKKNVKHNLVYR